MNDTTIEAIHALEQAESNEEILMALKPLQGQRKTKESLAVVSAAGNMLSENLQDE
jgi:hypothetical protein